MIGLLNFRLLSCSNLQNISTHLLLNRLGIGSSQPMVCWFVSLSSNLAEASIGPSFCLGSWMLANFEAACLFENFPGKNLSRSSKVPPRKNSVPGLTLPRIIFPKWSTGIFTPRTSSLGYQTIPPTSTEIPSFDTFSDGSCPDLVQSLMVHPTEARASSMSVISWVMSSMLSLLSPPSST